MEGTHGQAVLPTPPKTLSRQISQNTWKSIDPSRIFFYAPNIIGYCRVVLLLGSFVFIRERPRVFLGLYGASFGLDMIDGPVARHLGQSTRFGAALDMITDKFSSPAILLMLGSQYPLYVEVFVLCLVLDVASHYFHLQATYLMKCRSHKEMAELTGGWKLVKLFYGNKLFFGWACLSHELFIICLYWCYFEQGPLIVDVGGSLHRIFLGLGFHVVSTKSVGLLEVLALFFLPGFSAKTLVHLAQLLSACECIAKYDSMERMAADKSKSS